MEGLSPQPLPSLQGSRKLPTQLRWWDSTNKRNRPEARTSVDLTEDTAVVPSAYPAMQKPDAAVTAEFSRLDAQPAS